eukprot:TRINITY_DN633_c0_g2_i3.p1 TRINITY_DN633_c0_g2~~TRINITY_DN633_c0_g2_i3.p1  ORF type:complete len:325 (-),score=57.80 TRINITY_DN633_c0_g2_i3:227-1201(-)
MATEAFSGVGTTIASVLLLVLVGRAAAGGNYEVSRFDIRLQTRTPDEAETWSPCNLLVHESLTLSFDTGSFSSASRTIRATSFVIDQASIVVIHNNHSIDVTTSVSKNVATIRWTYHEVFAPATAQFDIYYVALGALTTHSSQRPADPANNMYLDWESVGTDWAVYLNNVTVTFDASTFGVQQRPQTVPSGAVVDMSVANFTSIQFATVALPPRNGYRVRVWYALPNATDCPLVTPSSPPPPEHRKIGIGIGAVTGTAVLLLGIACCIKRNAFGYGSSSSGWSEATETAEARMEVVVVATSTEPAMHQDQSANDQATTPAPAAQ